MKKWFILTRQIKPIEETQWKIYRELDPKEVPLKEQLIEIFNSTNKDSDTKYRYENKLVEMWE